MGEDNYSVRRLYPPTGDPPVKPGIKLGTRLDKDRRNLFSFSFEDGQRRSFYGASEEAARETATVWGLAHGRLAIVD